MHKIYSILTVTLAVLTSIIIVSCSEDNPSAPAVTPAVQIEVLTPSPEVGQPVLFKATVTGVALTAPKYEWDFGDGKTALISNSDSSKHFFANTGVYTIRLRLTDSVTNVELHDTLSISLVDNRTAWQYWNTAVVTVFGALHGVAGNNNKPSVRENFTLELRVGPIEIPPWSGNKLEYSEILNQGPSSNSRRLKVYFSNDAQMLDSLHISKGFYYWSGMSTQRSEQTIKLRTLHANGPFNKDSSIYRIDGAEAIHHVVGLCDESYWKNDYTGIHTWNYDSLAVTPDMYIEVRFYKK